jgi:heptosyltransferase-2
LPVITKLLVFAPNWLGDAVMALPALADVRRVLPTATIDIAARPSVAPLFTMVPDINGVRVLGKGRGAGEALRDQRYEAALLLPNSFNAARLAWRAGIPERWGYRSDFRSPLLTKGVTAPSRVHQADYYRHLVRALGITGPANAFAPEGRLGESHRSLWRRRKTGPYVLPAGPAQAGHDARESTEPRLIVSVDQREAGRALLAADGWDGQTPLIAIAPGAAFGGAKRWPAASFAALIDALATDRIRAALIGAAGDRPAAMEVSGDVKTSMRPIDLVGRTDIPSLAGVLVHCRALITNDSGAMHVAAAAGVAVIAMFGPTRERETHPLGARHTVLINPVWCRPCMLRECPLTHRCMTGIAVDSVIAAARAWL